MKRLFVLCTCLIFLLGCQDNRTRLFEMQFDADFQVPGSLNNIETFYFPIQNVSTFYDVQAGALSSDDIGAINSFRCTLSPIFAAIDYSFIQNISVTAIDPSNSNNRQELFYLDPNPLDNTGNLELFGSLGNHKSFLTKDLIHLEIRIQFRYSTPMTFDNRLTMTFQAFDEE